MDGVKRTSGRDEPAGPVCVLNAAGRGRFVVLVDHASRHVPPEYAMLGLSLADLLRHIAWDPGALPVASLVADALDAPLIHPAQSRLVIDVNRSPDAGDLIAAASEDTFIPGNQSVSGEERQRRMEHFYLPYHQTIEEVLARREREGLATALISIHTFTPVFRGVPRPWHVGILHGDDTGLARPLMAALTQAQDIVVGDNQPYSPDDGVYYTLAQHGDERGLATAMIEIRNNLVADEDGQRIWAGRLTNVLGTLDLPARAA